VKPARTPSGHRLYSDEDIERLILLHRATVAGESIGQIANLSRLDLALLAADSESEADTARSRPAAATDSRNARYHLDLCVEAIRNLDAANLEARLLRASIALGQQVFLEQVLQPLLVHTGEQWDNGHLKVSHEHLASAVIRSLLGSMVVASPSDIKGPVLLSTTPTGQLHEFGALMASVTAASLGWQAVYLGPNLPAEDIVAAVNQRKARALAISIVYPSDDPHLNLELKKLARSLDDNVRILAGGRSVESYANVLNEIGATRVTNLGDLRVKLVKIREELDEQSTA
jgi:methanogenic corrinoid protein MtbC1